MAKMVKAKALQENIEGQGNSIGDFVDVPADMFDALVKAGYISDEEVPAENKSDEQLEDEKPTRKKK